MAEEKFRLQVSVDRELADRIDYWAKRAQRSQSFVVAEWLSIAIEQRTRFVDWLSWRLIRFLGGKPVREVAKLLKKFAKVEPRTKRKEVVYLQALVAPELVDELDKLAGAQNRTRAEMAGLLLNWLIEDEEWLIGLVDSKAFRTVDKLMGGKTGGRAEWNREENKRRGKDE